MIIVIDMIINLLKKTLKNKGYVNKYSLSNSKILFDPLYLLLFVLQKKNYKIIQVGSNIVRIDDDPIYAFIEDYNDKITYLGFEPQEKPFNELKKIYQKYDNFYLIKQCVGKEGKSKFYYLNKEFENFCKKNNLSFSNGVNSLVKENLSKRLIKQNLNPDDYIESYETEVLPLKKSIEINHKDILDDFRNIDLLQIDAEGYDDQVIYESSIDFFKPKYINFESKNLEKNKLKNLVKYLKKHSYECIKWKNSDHLAVLSDV